MTFAEYLERMAHTDAGARAFLELSDRAMLDRVFWGDLTREMMTDGRDEAYIREAGDWFKRFARAGSKAIGAKVRAGL